MFSFLYHWHYFYRTWLYMWVTRRVSYKKQELLTLREHMSSPSFFFCGGVCVLLYVLCCPDMCHYILSSVLWSPLRFPYKNDVRFVFTPSWLYEGLCLIYIICVCFAHSGIKHILCCAFVVFFFVLCTLCCQFHWIVHCWLSLPYSLTFIYYGV